VRHDPEEQWSPVVQASPSEHVFALFGVYTQAPEVELQVSSVQGLASLHETMSVVTHDPDEQWSPVVQAFPSEQVLLSLLVYSHSPLVVLNASSVQAFPSLQVTAVPTQVPEAQWSSVVRGLPSEQAFESLLVYWHAPDAGLHSSSVQGFPSLQATVVPTQALAEQWSLVVQALPSEHVFALFGV
jgi:hypothetical protein